MDYFKDVPFSHITVCVCARVCVCVCVCGGYCVWFGIRHPAPRPPTPPPPELLHTTLSHTTLSRDIVLRFEWQAWHTWFLLVARSAGALCASGVSEPCLDMFYFAALPQFIVTACLDAVKAWACRTCCQRTAQLFQHELAHTCTQTHTHMAKQRSFQ